ncbi:DUF5067 domain-containing protein [Companilactobacillus allii]|uniref:DUF5067 domain-containing protein n=1 Tax=Companilactobacillus allii TaxID=1847728 RepID=A0A1P8Q5Z4_9LACO|nr:DUF5067 domain-containing protein [Companilactobacillus allii]APX73277.1 hypothetical protein BTM29_12295 [Companilactobacillus allii]USQ68092.1 DUF5067 domain-containing protein [Companilactobacillus allii]
MKTKGLALTGLTILLASTLVGCSSGNDNSSKKESSNDNKTIKVAKKNTDKYYFKNNKLVTRDLSIQIIQNKVLSPGETGNDSDKPVIAFWYKVTNKTNKEIDANTAWIAIFKAVQDNNENTINELKVAALPDNQYLDSQASAIKKNGTVENAVAYTLSDTNTPVQLNATKGVDGKKLGTMKYELNYNEM